MKGVTTLEKKEHRFSMRLSDRMYQKLDEICEKNDRSKTAQIEEWIRLEWEKRFGDDGE